MPHHVGLGMPVKEKQAGARAAVSNPEGDIPDIDHRQGKAVEHDRERTSRLIEHAILPVMPTDRDAHGSKPVPETAYYPNGGVKLKGYRLDGELHGAWEWYRTDGTVMRTGQFERGRQVGVWRTFERSGRVVKETSFKGR
jgi:hypothetical protein